MEVLHKFNYVKTLRSDSFFRIIEIFTKKAQASTIRRWVVGSRRWCLKASTSCWGKFAWIKMERLIFFFDWAFDTTYPPSSFLKSSKQLSKCCWMLAFSLKFFIQNTTSQENLRKWKRTTWCWFVRAKDF